jgi:hypothetical protein
MLVWQNDEKAAGAVAVLKEFNREAAVEERGRLIEQLHRWQRDPKIRTTLENFARTASSF